MSRLVCIGLGYTAGHVARRLSAMGWRVGGTTRTSEHRQKLAGSGHDALLFDGSRSSQALRTEIAAATHLLMSAPPGEAGDPLLRCHAYDIAVAPRLQWIGYLSTIGVYGDHGGGWVDEETAVQPVSLRSRQRVEAEEAWRTFAKTAGRRLEVFRLPSIYGPGRSAIDALLSGTARRIVKPDQVFNRAHVEDIATVIVTAMTQPPLHSLYNIADDEPTSSEEPLLYAAELLGIPPPPAIEFSKAALSPMAMSFYAECKRVSNRRIKRDLGITLAYPTYREGVRAIAGILA